MNIANKKRNIGLDVARTIAILLVLFSHTLWISDHYPKVVSSAMKLSGTAGVEIFFIISGFLIGKIVWREILLPDFSFKNVKHFLLRRWFRTFPNYYLLLFVNVLVWYFIYGEFPEKIYKYILYVQNFADTSLPFYRVSWSLAVEQFSYIIGPILLYGLIRFFPKKNRDKFFLWVTIFILICFTLTKVWFYYYKGVTNIFEWNESIRKVLIYRLDAVYWGFLLRYFYNKYNDWMHRKEKLLLVVGLFGLIFLNVLRVPLGISVEQTPGFMIIFYLALHSIAICCVIPYLVSMEMKSKMGVKFFTTISLISYSLYLLHYTIILHSLKTVFPSEELRGVYLWLYTFLYWGITILFSYLLYRYFERPITNLRESPRVLKFLGYSKN